MTSVPGFLTKTFEIFSSPEYSDCCGWGANGETIIIRKIEQFSKQVLPKYFKHSNFQSFVRQLNMYDFHKTIQDPHHGEFVHEYFRQNKPELLVNIKRKANKPPEANSGKGKNNVKGNGNNALPGPNSRNNPGQAGKGPGTNKAGAGSGSNVAGSGTSGSNPLTVQLPMNPYNPNINSNNNMNYPVGGPMIGNYPALPPSVPDSPSDFNLISDINFDEDAVNAGNYPQPHHPHTNNVYDHQYGQHLPENIAAETGGVIQELYQQRLARENFERRMEQKLASLQGENNMLKRMFMESHHKNAVMQERMERVMKTLYTMFVNGSGGGGANAIQGGNSPGVALTHRAPSMLLTDMQHFLQQQKNSSDSEIELLEGMGVDTHPTRPPPLMPLLPLLPGTSLEGPDTGYGGSGGSGRGGNGSSSSRGTGNNGVTGYRNGGQVVEVGSYAGSGLKGGLGRPIVLGNGEDDELVSPTYFTEDGRAGSERLSAEEHRLLRLDSATLERLPSLDLDDLVSITSENNIHDISAMDVETPVAVSIGGGAGGGSGRTGRVKTGSISSGSSSSDPLTVATSIPTAGTAVSSGGEGHYMHLLNRPMAGQALGDHKVTSFDIVAGAVTAPSLRQQSSFDGAYLPTPSDDFSTFFSRNNTTNSMNSAISKSGGGFGSADGIAASAGTQIGSGAGAGLVAKQPSASGVVGAVGGVSNNAAPPGRVFLSIGDSKSAICGGNGHNNGDAIGIGSSRPPLGAAGAGAGDIGGTRMSPLPLPLLARQRTFDASLTLGSTGTGTTAAVADPQLPKRRVENSFEGGSSKKQKASDNNEHDIAEEMSALESEDVHSSLSEAQQFMDLLNRNQQTTLTRLDSLEQTIACLFDGPDGSAGASPAAATTGGANTSSGSFSKGVVKEETDLASAKEK